MVKKTIYSQIKNQFRHDTIRNWETTNPILYEGEVGVVTGLNEIGDKLEDKTQKAKIGDGIHPWNELEWWSFIQSDDAEAVEGKQDKFAEIIEYDEVKNIIKLIKAINEIQDSNGEPLFELGTGGHIHFSSLPRHNKTPIEDGDITNKKYVDDKLGDIETLLGGI